VAVIGGVLDHGLPNTDPVKGDWIGELKCHKGGTTEAAQLELDIRSDFLNSVNASFSETPVPHGVQFSPVRAELTGTFDSGSLDLRTDPSKPNNSNWMFGGTLAGDNAELTINIGSSCDATTMHRK
jgi:hypothetical protein